jgi:hypothetical protein
MKENGGSGGIVPLFLTSALCGSDQLDAPIAVPLVKRLPVRVV